MENLFEQHIERMEKLQSVYEPHTGQHNILGMLINECKQALHKHSVSGKRPDYDTILAVVENCDSLVQWKEGETPEHCILPEHYGQLAKDILAACASGAVDKTVSEGLCDYFEGQKCDCKIGEYCKGKL